MTLDYSNSKYYCHRDIERTLYRCYTVNLAAEAISLRRKIFESCETILLDRNALGRRRAYSRVRNLRKTKDAASESRADDAN